ncbi:hypothetical protein NYO67_1413 [Aspergillus flavus]|nr:hypothetical protein NYO67_1413 [Aspergillus flavus]
MFTNDGLIVVAWVLAIGQTYTVWMCMYNTFRALWSMNYLLDLVIRSDTKLTYQGYHSSDVPPLSTTEKVTGQKKTHRPLEPLCPFRCEHVPANLQLPVGSFSVQSASLRYVFDYPTMDSAAQKAAGADANGIKDGKVAQGGHCINQKAFFLGSAAFTIVTEIWLLCIPAIIIWRLRMPRQFW